MLGTLVEGLRVLAVLLHPYLPASTATLLRALGAPDVAFAGAQLGAGAIGRGGADRAAVPEGPRRRRGGLTSNRESGEMIDSHTHLDLCEPPDAELVAAADEAGVTRMLTVGTEPASCRAALAAAEAFPQVYAAIGRHPNAARRVRRRRPGGAARAGGARALPGDRRDGPGLLPRRRAARRPGAGVRRAHRARARDGPSRS